MVAFKYLSIIIIGFYVFAQLFSIIPSLKDEQTITVYRRNYDDTNAYIKGYKIANVKVEVFDVRVKPNNFGDRMLLTHEDENVLTDIVKALAGLAFAWYIFKLEYDNVFSKKSLNRFWLALFLYVMTFITLSIGEDHTSDFYRDVFLARGGDKSTFYDFQRRLITNSTTHDFWIYYWIPLLLLSFYRTFKDYHEGKSANDVFGLGSSNEDQAK